MNDAPHILLSEIPAHTPRRPERNVWEQASADQTHWRLIRDTVKIERVIDHGDQYRVEFDTGDRLTVNAGLLSSPAVLARHVEAITHKPLGVPADIQSLDGWIPYINSLLVAPEAAHA